VKIEVVFALPSRQELVELSLDENATVEEAIRESGIAESFPDEDLSTCQAGVWGKPVGREHVLEEGNRVELYRPLVIDPREARRQRARSGKSMGRPTRSAKDRD
jgi:putative ubiquitin-RnfH superfamily antitoxin RatB of RatAB toxin-antitoxin module